MDLKVAREINFKSYDPKKEICNYVRQWMLTRIICGGHFAVCAYIKSPCCTPKTNMVLCVNYISVKLRREKYLPGKPWKGQHVTSLLEVFVNENATGTTWCR